MNNWYKTFIVLAECGSYTETAKRMYCSQPTVTQHIQQLEKNLACRLINRNKRKVELTQQGEIVLSYAKIIYQKELEMKDALIQVDQQEKTTLFLSNYIASHYFDDIFGKDNAISKNHPYEINCYCYPELKTFLMEGKTHFAVMPIYRLDPTIPQQFDIDYLFEEDLSLAISPSHPLAKRQVLYGRDLKGYSVYLPHGEMYSEQIKTALREKDISPNYLQMSNFVVIAKAIQHGVGMAFLPNKVIEQEGLESKEVKGLRIKRQLAIVMKDRMALTPNEKAICEHIKAKLGTPVST